MALKLGRPIKWIATRSEDFVTTIQGRDQAMTSELALKRDGTMLGLKVRVVANLGAYLYSSTAGPPQRMMAMAPGSYQIQNVHVEVVAVFTNTVPTGPYRGAGRPESVLNIERLIDKAAKELGIDRLEIGCLRDVPERQHLFEGRRFVELLTELGEDIDRLARVQARRPTKPQAPQTLGQDAARLWDASVPRLLPPDDQLFEFEVRSGVRLDEYGKLVGLSYEEWRDGRKGWKPEAWRSKSK